MFRLDVRDFLVERGKYEGTLPLLQSICSAAVGPTSYRCVCFSPTGYWQHRAGRAGRQGRQSWRREQAWMGRSGEKWAWYVPNNYVAVSSRVQA